MPIPDPMPFRHGGVCPGRPSAVRDTGREHRPLSSAHVRSGAGRWHRSPSRRAGRGTIALQFTSNPVALREPGERRMDLVTWVQRPCVECSGAIRIGRRAWEARVWETLPSRVLRSTPRPRWPHTIKRADRLSAVCRIVLEVPSKDSLINGEALYPCSLARSAPSSRPTSHRTLPPNPDRSPPSYHRRQRPRQGPGERRHRLPHREHNGVHRSVDQIRRYPHRLARSFRTVEAEQYGTILAPSRHDIFPFPPATSRTPSTSII